VSTGILFVVATPIGNLDDLSSRARDVLARVDIVAAEDTRVTGRLLSHLAIRVRQVSLHDYNEESRSASLIEHLKSGDSVAIVSDAGTPLISDPGYRLIHLAHAAGITVSPVPGPSAAVAALSAAGLPTDRFAFEGFLPAKASARQKRLERLKDQAQTLVFFESVHRIAATLQDMIGAFGAAREAFIGRELTKRHEQCVAMDLAGLAAMLADGRIPAKGEFVLVVAGQQAADAAEEDVRGIALLEALVDVLPGKQAVDIVTHVFGGSRKAWYQRMLDLRADKS
jgi:16S rRNA (cytidine1402-2'-O)-methyltransferase